MVMFWPDGQRDGRPVPRDVVTTCTDFSRIFIQMCFLPFYFVWPYFNPLPIPYDILVCFIFCRMVSFLCILAELIYPQFCSHIIHTSVHKLYFIHRGIFLLRVYLENNPAYFTCFSRIFGCKFGAKRAFLQSCFFIISRYTHCRML